MRMKEGNGEGNSVQDGRPQVRLPVPGRKMPLMVPRRALATSVTLLILVVITAITHQWVASTQQEAADDIGGLPIGERTEWSLSFCLRVDPQKVEAEQGQNITFVLQWRAFHYDCPYWLPYDRSVEGVIVNTNITYENLVLLNETDWEPVDDLKETFRKEVTVQSTARDGQVKLLRDCPWYFDQRARGVVDVPDDDPGDKVEEKQESTLAGIWRRIQQSPLVTLVIMSLIVIIPVAIAARLAPSAVNRQPWRFVCGDRSISVSLDKKRDTYKISRRLDCGIAMLHLELGARHAGAAGLWTYPPDSIACYVRD